MRFGTSESHFFFLKNLRQTNLAKKYIVEQNAMKYPSTPRKGIPMNWGFISVRHRILDAMRSARIHIPMTRFLIEAKMICANSLDTCSFRFTLACP